ncbi:hypothetical protein EDD11_007121 [Mortierella claussenii]|nr:hypothetical protein EDD11_007121 [Mortierella claussenii]
MLTPPSAYAYTGNPYPTSHHHQQIQQQHYSSPGKSPSKRFSLQKYYYGRNAMTTSSAMAARMTPSRTPSPPPLAYSSPSTSASAVSTSHSTPASSSQLPSLSSSSVSVSVSPSAPAAISEITASMSVQQRTSTASATPPMLSLLPKQASNADSFLSPAELASLLEQSNQRSACAGPRRPLILDLRPHPEFYPISILHSININLPTLLVRRYRRGGPISSFALESFITMPADKDLYHQVQDSWRNTAATPDEAFDVVVLDQDMKAGDEAYGRSATAAWTLLNVLERGGGGSCFSGAAIRLWYLEGGFEAFQVWDASGKYLTREGCHGFLVPEQADQDMKMTLTVPTKKTLLAIDTSVAFVPKQKTSVRRESLFSLNTKSLQRPSGLNGSQTVSLRPLVIPGANHTPAQQQQEQQQQQPSKNGWLTVPTSVPAPALSPTMSMVSNHSMEITHSASTDPSSGWSADAGSVNGSGHFSHSPPGSLSMTLNTKRSMSSLLTLNSTHASSTAASICEEDEEQTDSGSGSRTLSVPHSAGHNWDKSSLKDGYSLPFQHHSQQDGHHFQYQHSHHHYDSHRHHHQQQRRVEPDEEIEDDGEQEISCILPNFLYLGPEILNQAQVEELDRLGVKRILNMATECEDQLVANRNGMEYHKVGVYDHVDADVSAGLLQAVDIIAAASDSPIYVHCKAGKSRSVTATIAYLITQLRWPLNKAYQHVLTRRPCMCPNIGFVTELMRMEERILGANKSGGLYIAP